MIRRMIHSKSAPAVLATGVVLTLGLVDIQEAEACDPAGESVGWTAPQQSDVIPPDTTFIFGVGGFFLGDDVITVVDEDDNEIDGEQTQMSMARLFSGMREFVPDEPLAAGEYTVTIDYEDNPNWPDAEPFAMTVTVDEDFEAPAAPEAVDFEWFHETHDEEQGDSCFMADEIHQIAVEPLADEPAYYEVILEHGDGSESLELLPSTADDGELHRYEVTDVECVSVVARLFDGSGGEVNKVCQPHKCKHYEGEANQMGLGFTDWSEVSGCSGEGTEEGSTEEGSCSSVSGSAPPLWLMLLVALGLVNSRRR